MKEFQRFPILNIRLQTDVFEIKWGVGSLGPHPDRNAGRSSPLDLNVGTVEPQSASFLPEQLTDSVAAMLAPAPDAPSAGHR